MSVNNTQFSNRGVFENQHNLKSEDSYGLTLDKDEWTTLVNILKTPNLLDHLSGIVIDTGASHHLTGNLDLLFDLIDIPSCPIGLPNGDVTMATKQGRMCIGDTLIISSVFYVPQLTNTLLSVARLLKEKPCLAVFTDKFCYLQDRYSRILIGAGIECDGIYYFRSTAIVQVNSASRICSRELWHRRLGHPAKSALSSLSSFVDLGGVDNTSDDPCEICVRAKHSCLSFSDSNSKADTIFSLIHCDVWGPYQTPALCGSVYFLTIVDDCSRGVWVFLMKNKSEVPGLLQNFCAMVERQYKHIVRTVRSDNGSEFMCLKSFFATHGILHQTSCVGTPQQNGRVERKHRHILNVARALRFQASLPMEFWGDCILAAGHLINRTPSSVLRGKTPYEILFGKPPNYTDIRIFGCLCFAYKGTRIRGKFDERASRCVFIGYPFSQKGWRVYDIERRECFVSRDVVFNENVFPYAIPPVLVDNIVHSSSIFVDDEDTVLSLGETGRADVVIPVNTPSVIEMTNTSNLVEIDGTNMSDTSNLEHVITSSPAPMSAPLLGRGHREKRTSVLLEPYEMFSATLLRDSTHTSPVFSSGVLGTSYPLANYVSCSGFSLNYSMFLANITAAHEPRNFKEAMTSKEWQEAMSMEITALEDTHTWDIVDLPPDKKAIGSKWVYKLKFKSDGSLERYKARLVALGNCQEEGSDFTETFAPVSKMTTIRCFFKIAAVRNWELHQMDVHNAFLHDDLDEEVYMRPPPGFRPSDSHKVCRLRKSLYGLRQAPRCWFSTFRAALIHYGFTQSMSDTALFSIVTPSVDLYVLVYVDDLVIGGNDSVAIAKFKAYLHKCFHMKDLGSLRYFLGIEVARTSDGIFLCQRKYCLDIVSECGLLGSRPAHIPIEQNHRLASASDALYSDPEQYRRIIGRLIYLTNTRPELSYTVHVLSQFMNKPTLSHWDAAMRAVRYLKGTVGQGIMLRSDSDLTLAGYCDSDWAACPLTRRSLTGYVFLLGGSPISWKTRKQPTVSRSSAEAEYRSMADAVSEVKWLGELFAFFGAKQKFPLNIYCDSKSAIHIASNPVMHQRTKHIEIDCHFVRDEVIGGHISPTYISTKD